MELRHLLILLIVGILAGWIASLLVKGRGLGLLGDMVVGVIGAFIGGFLFNFLGIVTTGILGLLIAAIVGAVVLLLIIKLIRRV